jgi:hypothetical protein
VPKLSTSPTINLLQWSSTTTNSRASLRSDLWYSRSCSHENRSRLPRGNWIMTTTMGSVVSRSYWIEWGSRSKRTLRCGVWSVAMTLIATTTMDWTLIATTLIRLDLISFLLSTEKDVTCLIKRFSYSELTLQGQLGV